MAFDNTLAWLAGVEFSSLFAYLIAAFFCLVLGYRVWDKYGRPKQTPLEPVDAIDPEHAAEVDLILAAQAEPQLNQQPQQEGADVAHEAHETLEPRPNAVPVQLDLLGFSTKQK